MYVGQDDEVRERSTAVVYPLIDVIIVANIINIIVIDHSGEN